MTSIYQKNKNKYLIICKYFFKKYRNQCNMIEKNIHIF